MNGAAMLALRLVLGLLPVCLFLVSLVYLDSYKLVRLRSILQLIGVGCLAAFLSYAANGVVLVDAGKRAHVLTIFVTPLIEEILKAVPILILIRTKRIGFLVDAAIFGFAVGTGFSLIENIYYFIALPDAPAALWIVRGFGTAVMHGASTAIVALTARLVAGSGDRARWSFAIPGLLAAYGLHALFNSFILPPVYAALTLMVLFPPILAFVFARSEDSLGQWLGSGFDVDAELLNVMKEGAFAGSPTGEYLHSLRTRFEGPVVADMLCIIRLQAELALRAKGMLMMRASGFPVSHDQEITEKLEELSFLQNSIGRTGERALAPVLHATAEDVWQLRMLKDG